MSRGVVLWPDPSTSTTIEALWRRLDDAGVPSLASFTHRRHRPHVSLIVGEHLDPEPTIDALGPTPPEPIPLRIEAVGVFPGGVLFLPCVMNDHLTNEHRRVRQRVSSLVEGHWPYVAPGAWTPHITVAVGLSRDQVARGLDVALDELPIKGLLDAAGIEDGSTGESWPLASSP